MSTVTSRAHPEVGVELIREWEPGTDARAAVLVVHGIAEHSGRYTHVGGALAEAGFRVRALDLIGHGATGGPRCDIDDWSRYHDQIQNHVEELRSTGTPVVLLGHSMGGNLALGYAASSRPSADLLVVSAPALGGGARWQRVLASLLTPILPTVRFPQRVTGAHLSRDPEVGERYFADPLVVTSATPRLGSQFFTAMDGALTEAGSIRVPVLVLHGGDDRLVPTVLSEPLADLPGFERRVYPGLRHEIFNEPEGSTILAEVAAWIDSRL